MPSPITSPTTLYPKITTHVTQVISHLRTLHSQCQTILPLPLTGTVKLHGTHADILIQADNTITFQSRNIVGLDILKDNSGFAAHFGSKTRTLLRLRDVLLARYRYLYPDVSFNPTLPVVIAGEYIGRGIQKHVAVSNLSKRFVIVSLHINGHWVNNADFSAISMPNHDIYNAARAGIFRGVLYPDDPQKTIDELTPLAEEVAAHCPFAATFGLEGEGEGIVWKIDSADEQEYNADPQLWFKTKGGRFRPTFARAPPPRQSPEAGERDREVAVEVAKVWCSEMRMQQGCEYMAETGSKMNMRGLGVFLKWVQSDILVEERGHIDEHGVDVASMKIEIAKIAKPWYIRRMEPI